MTEVTAVTLQDLEDRPFQAARWREVIEHTIVVSGAELDEVNEGFITLFLDEDDANMWGIYSILSISPGGTVAEYNVNIPYHYPTFTHLLTAAAARTAAT
jgi:hypothetical protein